MTSILRASASAVQKEIAFNSPRGEMAKNCREMARSNFSLACAYGKEALTGIATLCLPNSTSVSLTLKERCVKITKAPLLMLRSALLYLPVTNRVTQLGLRLLSPKSPADFMNCFIVCSSKVALRTEKAALRRELKIRYNMDTVNQFAAEHHLTINIQAGREFNPSEYANSGFDIDYYTRLSSPLTFEYIGSSEFKENEVKARYSKDTRREFIESFIEGKIKQKIINKEQITKNDFALSDDQQVAITKLGFTTKDYSNICLRFLAKTSEIICNLDLQKKISNYQERNPLN